MICFVFHQSRLYTLRFKFGLEEVNFLALSHAECCNVFAAVECSNEAWGNMAHKPVLEPEADRFVEGEAWFQRFEEKKKKHADIWRALKPVTFTALALKPSTNIKSVKRQRQRRQLIGEKQRREKQGMKGEKRMSGEGEGK